MRVLSVPQPATGTVDLVRSHPALTDRQLNFAHYAGQSVVKLDNIEWKGCDVHSTTHKRKRNGRTITYQFPEQELNATWYTWKPSYLGGRPSLRFLSKWCECTLVSAYELLACRVKGWQARSAGWRALSHCGSTLAFWPCKLEGRLLAQLLHCESPPYLRPVSPPHGSCYLSIS